jgi:Leucine-rich repeat (LRR) protein
MITEEYILKACDVPTVEGLTAVKLVVDTSYQSLLDLGDIVKNLENLTLDGSYISSVRDLGTGLRGLLRLSLDNCALSELDGIGMLSNLIELSVRDNQLSDITSLAMHESIQVRLHLLLLSSRHFVITP